VWKKERRKSKKRKSWEKKKKEKSETAFFGTDKLNCVLCQKVTFECPRAYVVLCFAENVYFAYRNGNFTV